MVEMKVTEIRAYGLPNLLQTQSVTVEAPTVSTVKYSKDALIDSAPERSCFTGKSPFTDTSGTQSVYESYKVEKAQVPNDQWKATFTFDKEYFQHAILLVNQAYQPASNPAIAETYRIYIGDSADSTACTECAGSPFTVDQDILGIEAWCNLPGQYTHILSDMSGFTGDYAIDIAALGIMGNDYTRDIEPLTGQRYIQAGGVWNTEIGAVTAQLPLGNTMSISFRWKFPDSVPSYCALI